MAGAGPDVVVGLDVGRERAAGGQLNTISASSGAKARSTRNRSLSTVEDATGSFAATEPVGPPPQMQERPAFAVRAAGEEDGPA
ncbi:hypothetical protein VSR01_09435 [Actinacidiphila sp. DG2A-62]|uniref:hypothetical protein n=1 Tax=Actinacidiphila sp. DG2A-62 TaxID=3108821 RepID=UPI002DBB91F7|nr:hypothetical protein [Actinacidiphila sp. DG2A-62]MEC3993747.1 hypothetical protein [Actinacidiphila sp. DG2A-62]